MLDSNTQRKINSVFNMTAKSRKNWVTNYEEKVSKNFVSNKILQCLTLKKNCGIHNTSFK